MVGIVVAGHGRLPECLLQTVMTIVGERDDVRSVCFAPAETPDALRLKLLQAVKQVECGQGVLILADLAGGSPFNAAAQLVCEGWRLEVVGGVNVPMLAEVLAMRNSELPALTQIALESGCGGVRKLSLPQCVSCT